MKVTFESDEPCEIDRLANAQKMQQCIWNAKQFIRTKLKHQNPSEETIKVLEEIREILYIEAFDD